MIINKVFIDCETLPPIIDLEEFKLNLQPPGNITKEETKKAWIENNWEEKYKKMAVDTSLANICSIAFSVNEQETKGFISADRDEKFVLNSFKEELLKASRIELDDDIELEFKKDYFIWIGFNNKKFDMDLIWKRAMHHGIYDLARLIPRERYSKNIVDLMEIWNPFDSNKFISFDEVCRFFGFAAKENDIDGSKVYDMFQNKQFSEILDYNISDVEKVKKLYKIIKNGL